jgi:methyl-accepting chemotaxis protein
MNNPASKRRNVFIKKAFQARFMLGVVGLILLSSLCSAALIYWITGGDLQAQSQSAHVNITSAWQRLGLSILLSNLVAVIVVGAAGITSALYASHKIAGPLFRFETLCEEIGDGKLETVTQLREGDQLQELGQAFSNMVEKLRQRSHSRSHLVSDLKIQIDLCAGDNLSPEQKSALATMTNLLAEFEQLGQS